MDTKTEAYKRAKRKVDGLRGFYIHLLVYVLINGFFSINVLVREWFEGSSWRGTIQDFSFMETYNERDQYIIENLVKKSLVIKIPRNNNTVIVKND